MAGIGWVALAGWHWLSLWLALAGWHWLAGIGCLSGWHWLAGIGCLAGWLALAVWLDGWHWLGGIGWLALAVSLAGIGPFLYNCNCSLFDQTSVKFKLNIIRPAPQSIIPFLKACVV
jgi:hypothetical protein